MSVTRVVGPKSSFVNLIYFYQNQSRYICFRVGQERTGKAEPVVTAPERCWGRADLEAESNEKKMLFLTSRACYKVSFLFLFFALLLEDEVLQVENEDTPH